MSLTSLAITLALPKSVKLGKNEARDLLALRLLDEGRLSQSQAAKALGITRHELLELMARHQVPVVRYAADEWDREAVVLNSTGQPAQRRHRQ